MTKETLFERILMALTPMVPIEKITFYDKIAALLDVLGGLDFIKTDADSRCVKIFDSS